MHRHTLKELLQIEHSSALTEQPGRDGALTEQLAGSLPSITWTSDGEGELAWVSDLWQATTGQPAAEALGYGWLERVHPEDRQQVVLAWREASQQSSRYEIAARLQMQQGHYRWHLHRADLMNHATTDQVALETPRWVGLSIDLHEEVTSRHEALSKAQAVLNTAVEGIITIDERGIVESMNPAAETMFGFRRHEVVGKNVRLLMPSPVAEAHDQYLANYLNGGEKKIIGIGREVVGKRKDGQLFPLYLAVSEVVFEDRRLFTGIVRDLTHTKQIEEALRREHELSDQVIATTPNIVLVLDIEGQIVRFNQYLETLTGWPANEVLGRDWFHTFLPVQQRPSQRQRFLAALAGKRTRGTVTPIVTRQGEQREIEWFDAPLHDGQGQLVGLLCTGVDLTELRAARDGLVQAERLAALGEMLSAIAHESRNALQRIKAGVEMLKMDLSPAPESTEDLHVIERASDDLTTLFENLRSYAGKLHLKRDTCQLQQIVHGAWSSLSVTREGRQATLHQEGTAWEAPLEADAFRLGQVFRNLFENALEAADDPVYITVTASVVASPVESPVESSVESSVEPPESALCVSVRDNGPGLSAEQENRLFEAFFSTKQRGTGLGMAIARRIIEAHHGSLTVVRDCSSPGAEFQILLPHGPP